MYLLREWGINYEVSRAYLLNLRKALQAQVDFPLLEKGCI
jgi:hypothetical protein